MGCVLHCLAFDKSSIRCFMLVSCGFPCKPPQLDAPSCGALPFHLFPLLLLLTSHQPRRALPFPHSKSVTKPQSRHDQKLASDLWGVLNAGAASCGKADRLSKHHSLTRLRKKRQETGAMAWESQKRPQPGHLAQLKAAAEGATLEGLFFQREPLRPAPWPVWASVAPRPFKEGALLSSFS